MLTGGPVVDGIWRRLLDRAGPRHRPPMTDDPDLHLLVDGERLDAHERRGSIHAFRMTGRPESVRIVSRDTAPDELGLARDPRCLGVALRRIALVQGRRLAVIDADDKRLVQGFHGHEPDGNQRWTNGDATVPAGLFVGFDKNAVLELHLGSTTTYRDSGWESAA